MEISIIIPAYNAEATIETAVASILNQPNHNMLREIIIVDDGSSDSTLQVVQGLSGKSPIIHLIVQKNAGQSIARKVLVFYG